MKVAKLKNQLLWATAISVTFVLFQNMSSTGGLPKPPRSLIADPHFVNGVMLLSPGRPNGQVLKEIVRPTALYDTPIWSVGQWFSRVGSSFANVEPQKTSTGYKLQDKTQSITFYEKATTGAKIRMELDGIKEFQSPDIWKGQSPSLMMSRYKGTRLELSELSQLKVYLKYRVPYLTVGANAQNSASAKLTFRIYDRESTSPTKGSYILYEINLYDSRYSTTAESVEINSNSRILIYSPREANFTKIGSWVEYDKDILPFIKKAIEQAFARGIFRGSLNLDNKMIGDVSFGVEVGGAYSTALEIADIDISATTKPVVTTTSTDPQTAHFFTTGWAIIGTAYEWNTANSNVPMTHCVSGYMLKNGACVKAPPIRILQADYGHNFALYNNATAHMASICNGKSSCNYLVSTNNLGDPKFGWSKDFYVTFDCNDGVLRTGYVGPEANTQKVAITCAQ